MKLYNERQFQGNETVKAGIAQLVERNLAKVEVASSNLVSRSKYFKSFMAEWQSGYAAACKAVDLGSIPGSASIYYLSVLLLTKVSPGGETGRRKGLKIPRGKPRAGSIPAPGTIKYLQC